MYLTFYGLNEKPFNTTPDPKFLYLTPGHREALAQLVYSVRENRGFLVLTGEVGTGKTTLLQAFLRRLDGKAAVAYVFNSMLPFEGLLEYVLEELKVPEPGSSPAQRLLALRRFMLDRRRAGQSTVLVLDEAQNLDVPTLERIRMLSNFETPTEKLLQILLVGQPELRAKLQRPELRQLQQRIELQCSLPPLSPEQTRDYIQTRLRVAGARAFSTSSATGLRPGSPSTRAGSRDASTFCAITASSSGTPTSGVGSGSTSSTRPSRRSMGRHAVRRVRRRHRSGRCVNAGSWEPSPPRCSPGSRSRRCESRPRSFSRSCDICATSSCHEQILRGA